MKIRFSLATPLLLSLSVLAAGAFAAPAESTEGYLKGNPERGYWFYDDPAADEDSFVVTPPEKPSEPPKEPEIVLEEEEQDCTNPAEWTVDCGFVDPGKSFDFQAKQRDELLKYMVMNPEEPQAVEAFQYYTKWIMDQAAAVGNMWYYNRVQNPELDPQATRPVSTFGLQLMSQVKRARAKDILQYLSDVGMLVFFSRSDCEFCHQMTPLLQRLSRDTGIELWNASLDDQCMEGLEERCLTAEKATTPARALQVSIVPTVFLYVEPDVWIRVSTGVTPVTTMQARIVNFFSAYRNAMVKGIQNGMGIRPPVDFTEKPELDGYGAAPGIAQGDGEKQPEAPSLQQISNMVNQAVRDGGVQ